MTIEEAKRLGNGDRLTYIVDNPYSKHFGKPVNVRVTGMAKTWKRDPNRVKVPVKYGLYESFYLTEENIDRFAFA